MYRPGETIHWLAFSSTSPDRPWDGNVQFEIIQKQGAWIDPISKHQGEHEILLPAGLRVDVLEVRRVEKKKEARPLPEEMSSLDKFLLEFDDDDDTVDEIPEITYYIKVRVLDD